MIKKIILFLKLRFKKRIFSIDYGEPGGDCSSWVEVVSIDNKTYIVRTGYGTPPKKHIKKH